VSVAARREDSPKGVKCNHENTKERKREKESTFETPSLISSFLSFVFS
jgi:hypothetical protein